MARGRLLLRGGVGGEALGDEDQGVEFGGGAWTLFGDASRAVRASWATSVSIAEP